MIPRLFLSVFRPARRFIVSAQVPSSTASGVVENVASGGLK